MVLKFITDTGQNYNNMEEKLKELIDSLKEGVVVFEYEKKDGSTRVAKGTLNEKFLPEREPDEFELDKESVDTLVGVKYKDLDEYMTLNKIELIGESEDGKNYKFKHKKKAVQKSDKVLSYYDLEKEEFRSFTKDNFKRILTVE